MLESLIVATAVTLYGVLTFAKIFRSDSWAATVTPLASIMGSGFLISAPILAGVVGNYSPLVMGVLLAIAWAKGGAIRFNIKNAEPLERDASRSSDNKEKIEDHQHRLHHSHAGISKLPINKIEQFSHLVLAAAYFISVTYYIQLLCQFTLNSFQLESQIYSRIMATVLLGTISVVGFGFGLKIIERVERYAINLNLAMIGALTVGLGGHNLKLLSSGDWHLPDLGDRPDVWTTMRICMGLLVVVQGFETSRFLGAEHSADQRRMTMKWAQGIAAAIYMVFLSLMLVVNTPEQSKLNADVTAIVTLTGSIAVVLPAMITVAAVGSQFSAAVADEAGCGGLLSNLLGRWLTSRTAYLFIGAVTITLAWTVDVKQVISLASRAFALFYSLQCVVAATIAFADNGHRSARGYWYSLLALLGLTITLLGRSTE